MHELWLLQSNRNGRSAEALFRQKQERWREVEPLPADISHGSEKSTHLHEVALQSFDVEDRPVASDGLRRTLQHPSLPSFHVDLDDIDSRLARKDLVERDHVDVSVLIVLE